MSGGATTSIRAAISAGLVLALFAAVATGLPGTTERATRERIAENRERALLAALYQVVPPASFDNELAQDGILVHAPEALGHAEPVLVYRARRAGVPVAVVIPVRAPDGYSGAIDLLLGVRVDGTITGVRVVEHRETPGLGDAIEVERSDWILGFDDRSLDDPPEWAWGVRRDGGDFDTFTGATITPRAVVGAVRRALQHFRAHPDLYLQDAVSMTGTEGGA